MNRDDIIHMARESELLTTTEKGYQIWMPDNLERFVALVAAAEREACAKVAEEWLPDDFDQIAQEAIAAKIRARGQE